MAVKVLITVLWLTLDDLEGVFNEFFLPLQYFPDRIADLVLLHRVAEPLRLAAAFDGLMYSEGKMLITPKVIVKCLLGFGVGDGRRIVPVAARLDVFRQRD
jgi:hypothetical protein